MLILLIFISGIILKLATIVFIDSCAVSSWRESWICIDSLYLRKEDNVEGNSQQDTGNNSNNCQSKIHLHFSNMSVFPDNVGWLSSCGEIHILTHDFSIFIFSTFLKSNNYTIFILENDESTYWLSEFVELCINKFINFFFNFSHFIKLKMTNSSSSFFQKFNKISIVISENNVCNLNFLNIVCNLSINSSCGFSSETLSKIVSFIHTLFNQDVWKCALNFSNQSILVCSDWSNSIRESSTLNKLSFFPFFVCSWFNIKLNSVITCRNSGEIPL